MKFRILDIINAVLLVGAITTSAISLVHTATIVGPKGDTGEQGIQGEQGEQGIQGEKGEDGEDGVDGRNGKDGLGIYSTYINDNGELIIIYTDFTTLNVGKVVGEDGKDGQDGAKGDKGDKGEDGEDGEQGNDGATPYIGEDGYWYINDICTNVKAAGEKGEAGNDGVNGEDGVGISSVDYVYTMDNVDYYAISYTNGDRTLYSIMNGIDGRDGVDGIDGADGVGIESIELYETVNNVDTYAITLTNGNVSYFNVTNGRDGSDSLVLTCNLKQITLNLPVIQGTSSSSVVSTGSINYGYNIFSFMGIDECFDTKLLSFDVTTGLTSGYLKVAEDYLKKIVITYSNGDSETITTFLDNYYNIDLTVERIVGSQTAKYRCPTTVYVEYYKWEIVDKV